MQQHKDPKDERDYFIKAKMKVQKGLNKDQT